MEDSEKTEVLTTLEDIKNISEAVNIVLNTDLLEQRVSFNLGVLGEKCTTPLKVFEREKNKLGRKAKEEQTLLKEGLKKADIAEQKEILDKIACINDDFNLAIDDLLSTTVEFRTRTFKLSDFAAKDDLKTKEGEVYLKKGASLVPVRFYMLMSKYLTE